MKWILALLLFISGTAMGQSDDTDKYIWYKYQYGSRMPRFWAYSVLKAAGLVKFTGIGSTVDTTTYKPLGINSSGNVVKLPGWPGSGSGSGSALLDTLQSITSGSTATIASGTNIVYIDPSSNLSTMAVTLPARPHPSNEITFYFGGTLTSGSVVTALSFVGNTGQTVLQASSPGAVDAGDFAIVYKFRTSNSKWYRKN